MIDSPDLATLRPPMHASLETNGDLSPALLGCVQQILHQDLCRSAQYVQSTESTNSDAVAELSRGSLSADSFPRLYLTDQQTAGRGRQGNRWLSTSDGLAFSLVIPWQQHPDHFPLSMIVGVAVAHAIEYTFAPLRVWLKWPNDIYLSGGKVGGILVESTPSAPGHCVVGIGININTAPDLAGKHGNSDRSRSAQSPAAAIPAVSLSDAVGKRVERAEILEGVIQSIVEATEEKDSQQWLKDYQNRCYLSGKTIGLGSSAGPRQVGRCRGVGQDGQLIVDTPEGRREFRSGQVHEIRSERV